MFYASRSKDPNASDTCILSNNQGTKAVIYPHLGGSLQQLLIKGNTIINNLIPTEEGVKHLNSSCSAILFPFANRMNKGKYEYKGQAYQLDCNETARGHALHGLVYRENWAVDELTATETMAQACLSYPFRGNTGFPFSFVIKAVYTLTNQGLQLAIDVENTGQTAFPFSLGWHPYFYSNDLESSMIMVDSTTEIIADKTMIPIKQIEQTFPNPLLLKGKEFDNAYVLNKTAIGYQTPDYQIRIQTAQDTTTQYLQLYIPSHRQSIAIEPMTAPADCYNNHIGFKELAAQARYSIAWHIDLV